MTQVSRLPRAIAPVPARLLRLLLCLSLMLNGIGTATASARMAAMESHGAAGVAQPQVEPQAAVADAGECPHHAAEAAQPQAPDPRMPHDDGECLQSCLAMCLQHCHAVPGVATALALSAFAQEPAQREFPAPRTPSSPPPVRPPIA